MTTVQARPTARDIGQLGGRLDGHLIAPGDPG
jgi:hypothetical protein